MHGVNGPVPSSVTVDIASSSSSLTSSGQTRYINKVCSRPLSMHSRPASVHRLGRSGARASNLHFLPRRLDVGLEHFPVG